MNDAVVWSFASMLSKFSSSSSIRLPKSEHVDVVTLEKTARLIAHIAGPSGSGKTTSLKNIKERFPDLVVEDLDTFEGQLQRDSSMFRHGRWVPGTLNAFVTKKQQLVNDFLEKNKNKDVVLSGYHTIRSDPEDQNLSLNLPTDNKYRMNTSVLKSVLRRYLRNKTTDPDHASILSMPKDLLESISLNKRLDNYGYVALSGEDVITNLDKILSEKLN